MVVAVAVDFRPKNLHFSRFVVAVVVVVVVAVLVLAVVDFFFCFVVFFLFWRGGGVDIVTRPIMTRTVRSANKTTGQKKTPSGNDWPNKNDGRKPSARSRRFCCD